METGNWRENPVGWLRFDLLALVVVLLMLPEVAHGELVFMAQTGWIFFDSNTVSINRDSGVVQQYELSPKRDLQGTGFGGSLIYWFVRLPALGAGLTVFSSSKVSWDDTPMDFMAICPYLLLRFPFFRSSRFPHGRIVPYAGIGPAFLKLSGVLVPSSDPLSSFDLHLQTQPVGLAAKAGLEWIIVGKVVSFGVFLEGQYLRGTLGEKKSDYINQTSTGWFPWFPSADEIRTEAQMNVSLWQLTLGMTLHMGRR